MKEIDTQSNNEMVKSFIVIKEMLKDRKIQTPNLNVLSEKEFEMKFNNNIFNIKANDEIQIIYHMESKFLKKTFEDFMKKTYMKTKSTDDEHNFKHIIFIFNAKINNSNEKQIRAILNSNFNEASYEYFPIKNVLFNITHHDYVPKHELVKIDSDEYNNIMNAYSLKTKSQFPIILRTDNVAKYYRFKTGDLIKITRSHSAIGNSVSYRVCV